MNPTKPKISGPTAEDVIANTEAKINSPAVPQRVAQINAEIANSPLASQGISQAPSAFNMPTTITSSSLSSNQNPLTLPETTQNTSQMAGATVQGATEGLNAGIQGMISAEDKKIADYQAQVQTQQKTTQSLIDKLMGKGQAQVKAETDADIPQKTQALTDITNEYNTKALEYRRMEEAVMKEGTLTDVQKNARLRQISREKNTELADIGIKQAVAQNNLSTAQQLVDRKIDLEYGDLKDIIGYQQSFLDDNREDLSKAEQNALSLKITENTRKYEEGKSIGEFAKTVAANGADAGTISRVSSAKTMAEAVQAAGQYAGDVLAKEKQRLEIQKLKKELNPISGNIVTSNPQVAPYYTAIQNASLGLPENQRVENQKRMNSYLANGDIKSAQELIIRTAFAGQTGTQKEDTIKRQNAIEALGTIKTSLDEYVTLSGDTNIVKGSLQGLAQKLGTAGNPELAAIGTKITLALQQYRNAVTGAAWGEQETDEYNQIFPSYKNTNKLNGAIIDAMQQSMAQFQQGTLGAYIGSETYNQIFNPQTTQTTTGSSNVGDDEAYQLYLQSTGQAPQDNPAPEQPVSTTRQTTVPNLAEGYTPLTFNSFFK